MEAYVYTEHSPECPQAANRYSRKCRCRKWIYVAGERKRISAKTRSWEQAEKVADKIRASDVLPSSGITVAAAVSDFLKDKLEQNVSDEWLDKLTQLLEKVMVPWCQSHGIVELKDLGIEQIKTFRQDMSGNPLTRSKKQERLRSFFGYCQKHGWIRENPAVLLSRIKVDRVPTDYFNDNEFTRLLDAISLYHPKGTPEVRLRARLRATAMLQLLRWSGLRLGDAARLERKRLNGNKLFLYMAKTGEPVYVPIPEQTSDLLHALENSNKSYFFWSGNGHPKTTVDDWWRTLSRIFKHANLGKRCHPHMLRDSFAIGLLLKGVSMETVSKLLGHTSIRVTEKHYAPWVKARQDQLEEAVRKAW